MDRLCGHAWSEVLKVCRARILASDIRWQEDTDHLVKLLGGHTADLLNDMPEDCVKPDLGPIVESAYLTMVKYANT